MKKCSDPEWYVYLYSINKREIVKFNVFHSHNFVNGCKIAFRKYTKPEQIGELEELIKSYAKYSFWSKTEYEIIMTGFATDDNKKKVDVYDQIMMNWDSFFLYAYNHKAFFRRK